MHGKAKPSVTNKSQRKLGGADLSMKQKRRLSRTNINWRPLPPRQKRAKGQDQGKRGRFRFRFLARQRPSHRPSFLLRPRTPRRSPASRLIKRHNKRLFGRPRQKPGRSPSGPCRSFSARPVRRRRWRPPCRRAPMPFISACPTSTHGSTPTTSPPKALPKR